MIDFSKIDLPEKVYKYRNWNSPRDQRVLTRNEVYFASPADFEDPHDCKNPIRYDLLSDNELRDYLKRRTIETFPSDTPEELIKREKQAFKDLRDTELLAKRYIQVHEDFYNHFGVLSLTAYSTENSMWEWYANSHKGFCIGFNSKIMFTSSYLFGGGGPVFYVDELPIIHPYNGWDERAYKLIFFKIKYWEFEKEYRIQKTSYSPLNEWHRKVRVPTEAYAEIILGAEITDESKKEIVNTVNERFPNLPILQAKKNGTKISIEPLK